MSEGLFLAYLSVPFEFCELCWEPSAATVSMSLLESFFSLPELLPFKLRRSVDCPIVSMPFETCKRGSGLPARMFSESSLHSCSSYLE